MKAVARGGHLYLTTNDGKDFDLNNNPLCGIRVLQLWLDKKDPIVEKDVTFGLKADGDKPGDKVHFAYPSLEVNKFGNMVIVYVRSGSTIYPEARISGWYAKDATILPSRLLQAGSGPYENTFLNYCKNPDEKGCWGTLPYADCAGASVDPSDDQSIWVATCYATSAANNNWAIWVGKVKM